MKSEYHLSNMIPLSLQQEYLHRDNSRALLQLVTQKEKAVHYPHTSGSIKEHMHLRD